MSGANSALMYKDEYWHNASAEPQTPPDIEDERVLQNSGRVNGVRVVYMPEVRKKLSAWVIVLMIIAFALLGLVVARYSEAATLNINNNKIRDQIVKMEREAALLKSEIAENEDISRIQKEAARLEMSFPEASNIRYIKPEILPEDEEVLTQSDQDFFDSLSSIRRWLNI